MAWEKLLLRSNVVKIRKNSGSVIGTRQQLNFIEGSNITLAVQEDAGDEEIDITITAGANGGVPESTFTEDGGVLVGTGSGTYQEETGATARASIGAAASGANADITSLIAIEEMRLDSTLSADGKYSGITTDIIIGYGSAAFGDLVYLNSADNRWEKTDASAEGTSGDAMIGLVLSAGATDGSAGIVLILGSIKKTDWDFPSGGRALYISETAGLITATKPTASGSIVRVIGYAGVDADTVLLKPSGIWIENS